MGGRNGQPRPQGAQRRYQQQPEQAPPFGLQVDDLIRLDRADLAGGHRQLPSLHVGGGQIAGNGGALRCNKLRRLHALGNQAAAGHGGGLQIVHANVVRRDAAGVNRPVAGNALGLDAVKHLQAAFDHDPVSDQILVGHGFTLGNVNGFHDVFSS